MSYIKKLQSKSEVYRKQVLVVSMAFCMLIVVSVWAYGLGDLFFKDKDEKQANLNEETRPFKLFANSIKNSYQNMTASVGNIGNKEQQEVRVIVPKEEKEIDLIPVEYNN